MSNDLARPVYVLRYRSSLNTALGFPFPVFTRPISHDQKFWGLRSSDLGKGRVSGGVDADRLGHVYTLVYTGLGVKWAVARLPPGTDPDHGHIMKLSEKGHFAERPALEGPSETIDSAKRTTSSHQTPCGSTHQGVWANGQPTS